MIFSFLLFLLPGVQSYSLFDYNSKPRGNEKERRTNGAVGKETLSSSNELPRKRNFDRNYDPHSHHPHLPPTESTLSAGLFHTCAVVRRGGVECGERPCGPAKCWGHDDRGQSTPPPGAMFTQLSAGGFFTCGLGLDGRAACWGAIDHPPKSLESLSREELSNVNHARRMQREEEGWRGDHSQRHVNGGGHYVQLSSGMRHACAISRDSEVHCWGRDDYGEGSPPDGAFVQVGPSSRVCFCVFVPFFSHRLSFYTNTNREDFGRQLLHLRRETQRCRDMLGQERHGPGLSSALPRKRLPAGQRQHRRRSRLRRPA